MRLGQVIAGAARLVRGDPLAAVTAIAYDSRAVVPGALFCALAGVRQNGVRFVEDALSRGAVAVLAGENLPGDFPLAISTDPRRAMAIAAAQFHHLPASRLSVVGVTGTNGKTTTAYLVEAMVRAAGRRAGLIGTVEQRYGDVHRRATHTTPESVDLQALLADMVRAHVDVVAMEVSSHALVQHRVEGIRFRAAGFTHLTRDHLDYHGTMDDYFAAKSQLFKEHLAADAISVVNTDDGWGQRLARELAEARKTVWTTGQNAMLAFHEPRHSIAGFEARLVTPEGEMDVRSPLVGEFNRQNALTAAGLALAAGVPLRAVSEALSTATGAPGRLEPVSDPSGRCVFVDYAHTDDALARVLASLRQVAEPNARIVTVFGCGGDRDRGKRPLMGKAAAFASDVVILTSDNPRTEDPQAILADIVPGIVSGGLSPVRVDEARSGARGYVTAVDRAEAIALAVRIARPGDVVLIAGKGHEDYQIVGEEKRPFDDRRQARAALQGERA